MKYPEHYLDEFIEWHCHYSFTARLNGFYNCSYNYDKLFDGFNYREWLNLQNLAYRFGSPDLVLPEPVINLRVREPVNERIASPIVANPENSEVYTE